VRGMSKTVVAAYRLVAAALALTGVALLFVVEHGGPGEFVYFTTQGNVLEPSPIGHRVAAGPGHLRSCAAGSRSISR
jgi:hypothetical protein